MSRLRAVVTALAAAVALASAGACSGGDASDSSSAEHPSELPPALTAFLDRVAKAGTVPFTATYEVLQKLGGASSLVTVDAAPPVWRIAAGDVVMVGGPVEATCRSSGASCRRGIDEAALSGVGVFSGFFADAPVRQVRTAAQRPDASAPVFSTQVVAGVNLDCLTIESAPVTACLTPDGVFGLVDDSARRYAFTSYTVSGPSSPIAPPYPVP